MNRSRNSVKLPLINNYGDSKIVFIQKYFKNRVQPLFRNPSWSIVCQKLIGSLRLVLNIVENQAIMLIHALSLTVERVWALALAVRNSSQIGWRKIWNKIQLQGLILGLMIRAIKSGPKDQLSEFLINSTKKWLFQKRKLIGRHKVNLV